MQSAADHATPVVMAYVIGDHLRHRGPVARSEAGVEALERPACRVFQSRRQPGQLFESGQRRLEVGFIEDLAAVDRVTVNGQQVDLSPLRAEAIGWRPPCRMCDDRPGVTQLVHSLDVAVDLRR